VLLEALSGDLAYPAPPTQAALARLSTPPAVPATLPAEWRALIGAMTSLDPAERPSAAEVAERLGTLAGGVGVADATAALRTTLATRLAATRQATDVLHARGRTSRLWRLADRARDRAGPVQERWWRAEPWHRWAAVAVVLLLVFTLTAVAGGGSPGPGAGGNSGGQVPSRLEQDLQDLREAVTG